jgi:hypothetical protein
MIPFCTDIDLLHWEPNILKDAAFASQTLISGTATLAGTALTIASGSFADAQVRAGEHAVVLSGGLAGTFPIVAVDSPTQLTISPLYDGLFPDGGAAVTPVPVGAGSGLGFVIRTFWPQRRVISELLLQAAGLEPTGSENAPGALVEPTVFCRPCALGTLNLIYGALSAAADAPAEFKVRATIYERLYRRALRSTRVQLDLDGDGESDLTRELNVQDLVRR